MQDDPRESQNSGERTARGEEDRLSWLKEQAEREERERARWKRTEVRGTRLRPDEAKELDRRASAAGLDVSSYMRLMCLAERPDLEGARNALRQVCRLVEEFEEAHQDEPPALDQVHALREAVDGICRSAQ